MLYANQRNEVEATQDASLLMEINGMTLHDVPLYVAGCQPCEVRTLIRGTDDLKDKFYGYNYCDVSCLQNNKY